MTFDIADRDILLKEAETFFGEGRIGDAIDTSNTTSLGLVVCGVKNFVGNIK